MAMNVLVKHQLNKEFLDKWHILWEKAYNPHLFNTPEWFLAYCEVFDVKDSLVLFIEEKGQLVALLPLVYDKVFGIRALVSPGGRFLDKSSLLLRLNDDSCINLIIKKLMSIDSFYLHELSKELSDMIVKSNRELLVREASINPYIPLTGDPFQYLAKDNKNKIFNRVKRNKEHLKYRNFLGDPAALEIAFTVDEISYKKTKGKPVFSSEREKSFFRKLLVMCKQHIVVNVVYYDNVPIVYDIGYLYKNTYQGALTSYNTNYRNLSPGKLLLYFILQRVKKEGLDTFDFSRGSSVFKSEFTNLSYPQYDAFYAKNLIVKYWWYSANNLYFFILENKLLYGLYLHFKKLLHF